MPSQAARRGLASTLFALVLAVVATGCGEAPPKIPIPELGKVSGKVTLGGEPLAGATVVFEPADLAPDRRESRAVTGADGTYEMIYIDDVKGAVLGPLTVRITKLENERQIVPEKYNESSQDVREVKAGENTFDFDLQPN